MILVIAGNYKEYQTLMNKLELGTLNRVYSYVSNVYEQILSVEIGTPYILYGTWYLKKDIHRFFATAMIRSMARLEFADNV